MLPRTLCALALSSGLFIQAQVRGADAQLDADLKKSLESHGFPKIEKSTVVDRLGRELNPKRVELGKFLFFDPILSLSNDNSCAGCHAPRNGFGDTQSIAIGIDNNFKVGPSREGPRNQRRTPMVLNNAFYPKLMWNGRFSAASNDPFDNSLGFDFPPPEGQGDERSRRFPANDKHVTHLLIAQGQMPSTELPEMAGFNYEGSDTAYTANVTAGEEPLFKYREPRFDGRAIPIRNYQNHTKKADELPHAIGGFFNESIRGVVLVRLNGNKEYLKLFSEAFPEEMKAKKQITMEMVGGALAEFEFDLTFVNAPIDQFFRGDNSAMSSEQKRGAITFFGKARCVECHSVAGKSNGMFSDFENHVIAIPQIAPRTKDGAEFPNKFGNVTFAGPGQNEDFGLEDITQRESDRYKFRTSPLRNIHLQPAFGHNGAWTRDNDGLENIIRHHLNPITARTYDPSEEGVTPDLQKYVGPIEPPLSRLSPRLSIPILLTDAEISDLVSFVRDGLADPDATPVKLMAMKPSSVPSGLELQIFE